VSFAATTVRVVSERVFIVVVVHFVIDSVRKIFWIHPRILTDLTRYGEKNPFIFIRYTVKEGADTLSS
jgi:hypothetical protein